MAGIHCYLLTRPSDELASFIWCTYLDEHVFAETQTGAQLKCETQLQFLPGEKKKGRILTRAHYGNIVRISILNPKAQTIYPSLPGKSLEIKKRNSRKCQKQQKDTKFKMFVTKPDLKFILRKKMVF